jgi:purine-binding chemotaxis protein CheW
MMTSQTYLTFTLNDLFYGLEVSLIREIFLLPELTPIAEAPKDIIGILNLRGSILPVMHLERRLGQTQHQCQLSDRVIVIEWEGIQIGLVVHSVEEVATIAPANLEAEPNYGHASPVHSAFVAAIAKVDEAMIVLLNPETLIREPDQVALLTWQQESTLAENPSQTEAEPEDNLVAEFWATLQPEPTSIPQSDLATAQVPQDFYALYCPEATEQERQIFAQRAANLRQPLANATTATEDNALAVFRLGEEYFGIDLTTVQEFIDVDNVTPVPCCPAHVVGNMNLRGGIMTLVDIRPALQHHPKSTRTPATQAIVVQAEEILAGITVDEVLDIVPLSSEQLTPIAALVSPGREAFFQGTMSFRSGVLSVLNLPKLLLEGGLVVEESVR